MGQWYQHEELYLWPKSLQAALSPFSLPPQRDPSLRMFSKANIYTLCISYTGKAGLQEVLWNLLIQYWIGRLKSPHPGQHLCLPNCLLSRAHQSVPHAKLKTEVHHLCSDQKFQNCEAWGRMTDVNLRPAGLQSNILSQEKGMGEWGDGGGGGVQFLSYYWTGGRDESQIWAGFYNRPLIYYLTVKAPGTTKLRSTLTSFYIC